MKNLKPGHGSWQFKAGHNGFKWKGMQTEGDPSCNQPNRPRLIINGRLRGGAIHPRSGLAKAYPTALHSGSACALNLGDDGGGADGGLKLWVVGDGCPGLSSSAGFYVASLDPEQDPEWQRAIYRDTATTSLVLTSFDGGLYMGVDSTLYKINVIKMPWGTENFVVAGSSQDTAIHTFTGYTIKCLQAFDGKLFIGLDGGSASASKIATYDGTSIEDDLTGVEAPTCFGLYHAPDGGDAIVVGFVAGVNHIRYRTGGESPGTWTTVTPGPTFSPTAMVAFKDVLYIGDSTGGNGTIYSWNGSSFAVARLPLLAANINSLIAEEGTLWFCFETTTAQACIGKYDGSTWTDVEKNLTAQLSGTSAARALAVYKGFVICGGTRSTTGRLFFAPLTATSGTWTEFAPNATSGEINQLTVH